MKKNLGAIDRLLRLIVAIILCDLCIAGKIPHQWNIFAWLFSLHLILTAWASTSPLYALLHIHTNRQP